MTSKANQPERPKRKPPRPGVPRPSTGTAPRPPSHSETFEANEPASAILKQEVFTPAPGAVLGGKYELKHPLRKGAMGSVWVAQHLDLEITVAVKLMSPDSETPDGTGSPSISSQSSGSVSMGRSRFEREAKTAAQLKNANVVRVLDYGVFRETPYMVMEMLDGEDLASRLKRVTRLSISELAQVLVPVARALHVAHEAGLVHRDLKPGNIFLAVEGADEVPKILDFGVARSARKFDNAAAEDLTVDGMVVGTPGFMSPEQATGQKDIDHRADIWSLGVVAYYALTGVKPFPGPGTIDTLLQICHQEVRPPSQIVPELPPEVDAFIARALQKERRLRFQSSMEVARALKPFLPSSLSLPPVPLPPPPPVPGPAPQPVASNAEKPTLQPPRPTTPTPRNRTVLIGIGAASFVVVLTVVAIAWAILRKGDTEPPAVATSSAQEPIASSLPTIPALAQSSATTIAIASAEPPPSASATPTESAKPAETPPQPTEDNRTAPKTTPTSETGKKRRDLGY